MKNTLLTVLNKKGYSINLNNNDIVFFNSNYSINLSINATTFNVSINSFTTNPQFSTFLISFKCVPFNIKLIRSCLFTILNKKTDCLTSELNQSVLFNDRILKICYNDLYYLLEDYLNEMFINL